jgi:hypothetical protein
MKTKSANWAKRYITALDHHLGASLKTDGRAARKLGCEARSLGLPSLECFRIHERGLMKLAVCEPVAFARADRFFNETLGTDGTPVAGNARNKALRQEDTQSENSQDWQRGVARTLLTVHRRLGALKKAAIDTTRVERALTRSQHLIGIPIET